MSAFPWHRWAAGNQFNFRIRPWCFWTAGTGHTATRWVKDRFIHGKRKWSWISSNKQDMHNQLRKSSTCICALCVWQSWPSIESTSLPPMWHMWIESDSLSHVDWVCWFFTLLWEVFPRVLRFSPLIKNQNFTQFDLPNKNCAIVVWAILIFGRIVKRT